MVDSAFVLYVWKGQRIPNGRILTQDDADSDRCSFNSAHPILASNGYNTGLTQFIRTRIIQSFILSSGFTNSNI